MNLRRLVASKGVLTGVLALLVVALGAVRQPPNAAASQPAGQNLFALTASGRLLQVSASAPDKVQRQADISGLGTGETLVGIDFRPANGQLVGVSSASRLYTIDPLSGAATPLGTAPLTTTLQGAAFGFDFNPTVDRIRLVSDAGQNLRLNQNNGAVAGIDGTLAYSGTSTVSGTETITPTAIGIVAAAYTNNVSPTVGVTPTTQLFVIDSERDLLSLQSPPNAGVLNEVGPLGIDVGPLTGFDITPSGLGYVSVASGTTISPTGTVTSTLYRINLSSGALTSVGSIGNLGDTVVDIAFPTLPAALPGATLFGVTASNQLVEFNSNAPGTILGQSAITGLGAGETLLGLDFRPATGQLFGISSASRLYTLSPRTGAATPIGTAPLTTTIQGTAVGLDFNPTIDRIRLVTSGGQNFVLNPNNGAIANLGTGSLTYTTTITDVNSGSTPSVVAAGYTNNVSPTVGVTPTTTLYVIDVAQGALAIQNPPNNGVLNTVGSLGITLTEQVSFDITPGNGAFVVATATGATSSTLYSIDLASGALTSIGPVGGEPLVAVAAALKQPARLVLPVVLRLNATPARAE